MMQRADSAGGSLGEACIHLLLSIQGKLCGENLSAKLWKHPEESLYRARWSSLVESARNTEVEAEVERPSYIANHRFAKGPMAMISFMCPSGQFKL